jgi:hypothetical protein
MAELLHGYVAGFGLCRSNVLPVGFAIFQFSNLSICQSFNLPTFQSANLQPVTSNLQSIILSFCAT